MALISSGKGYYVSNFDWKESCSQIQYEVSLRIFLPIQHDDILSVLHHPSGHSIDTAFFDGC